MKINRIIRGGPWIYIRGGALFSYDINLSVSARCTYLRPLRVSPQGLPVDGIFGFRCCFSPLL